MLIMDSATHAGGSQGGLAALKERKKKKETKHPFRGKDANPGIEDTKQQTTRERSKK